MNIKMRNFLPHSFFPPLLNRDKTSFLGSQKQTIESLLCNHKKVGRKKFPLSQLSRVSNEAYGRTIYQNGEIECRNVPLNPL